MPASLTLPAPAKINRYLHIVGKRADGYHLLDTEFELIDLCDTVKLSPRQDGEIVLHTPITGLPDAQHLAVRAALALQKKTKTPFGADLWVHKTIPTGAGLGGGSSDAATTLMGLNQLWQCGLSRENLQILGLSLGADVPFFCSQLGRARATGIGEVLTPENSVPTSYVLIYPACQLSTQAVFKLTAKLNQAPKRTLNPTPSTRFFNDLEPAAQATSPIIAQALNALLHHTGVNDSVQMSGSGSAVVCELTRLSNESDDEHTSRTQSLLKLLLAQQGLGFLPNDWQIWAVRNLPAHPIGSIILSSD